MTARDRPDPWRTMLVSASIVATLYTCALVVIWLALAH